LIALPASVASLAFVRSAMSPSFPEDLERLCQYPPPRHPMPHHDFVVMRGALVGAGHHSRAPCRSCGDSWRLGDPAGTPSGPPGSHVPTVAAHNGAPRPQRPRTAVPPTPGAPGRRLQRRLAHTGGGRASLASARRPSAHTNRWCAVPPSPPATTRAHGQPLRARYGRLRQRPRHRRLCHPDSQHRPSLGA
jgi:hypothetical protein